MNVPLSHIPTLAVWETIHRDDWGPVEARHFLERAGFAAQPDTIEEATDLGPEACCERFFTPSPFLQPPWVVEKFTEIQDLRQQARKTKDKEERSEFYREANQISRQTIDDIEHEWLLRASRPETGFSAKWELFLSDVWVIGKRTVREPEWIASYWKALSEKSTEPYPEFCKAFSREPAMIRYLDVDKNSKNKPNENFARELLELFILGEGNYTEFDIKEAARAFTGRRLQNQQYREYPKQFDDGTKTVFSRTGQWTGDNVIDLIFQQPASRTFLPSEAIRFYLTREPITADRIKLLGDLWAEEDFRLDALRRRLFTSRAFYASDCRGNRIKSPIEFYIGTLQRFGLQPIPLRQYSTRPLAEMGQELFEPPNVRGWIGGEAWINAGKLAARRQAAAEVFATLPMNRMNADDKRRIEMERERDNSAPFRVKEDELLSLTGTTAPEVVEFIRNQLLTVTANESFYQEISNYLGKNPSGETIEDLVITVLQSPQYQLS